MTDLPANHKIPKDSVIRDYDVFEEFPDGSTVWRACVFGKENVELKVRELSKETPINSSHSTYEKERCIQFVHRHRLSSGI